MVHLKILVRVNRGRIELLYSMQSRVVVTLDVLNGLTKARAVVPKLTFFFRLILYRDLLIRLVQYHLVQVLTHRLYFTG